MKNIIMWLLIVAAVLYVIVLAAAPIELKPASGKSIHYTSSNDTMKLIDLYMLGTIDEVAGTVTINFYPYADSLHELSNQPFTGSIDVPVNPYIWSPANMATVTSLVIIDTAVAVYQRKGYNVTKKAH